MEELIYEKIVKALELEGEINININRNKKGELSIKVANKEVLEEGGE